MDQPISAQQMLDAFKADAPGHNPDTRWAHTFGLGVVGYFQANDVAKNFAVAKHFQGQKVPVIARFSNGSSVPVRHDEQPDTRGLAVKFQIDDSTLYDLLSMTLPVFGAKTREDFLGVSKAFVPKPIKPESWFRQHILDPLMLRQPPPPFPPGVTTSGGPGLAKYAGTHKFAQAFVINAGLAMVPVSWARTAYNAVHTFILLAPDGERRFVRFAWEPVEGVFPVPSNELAQKSTDFLTAELAARLAIAPVEFTLKMTIGDPGDDFDDPTIVWPVTRRAIRMGTLVIEEFADRRNINVEKMSFNPMRLPPGIEPSGDAILRARGEIYQLGCKERNGTGCPVMHQKVMQEKGAAG